MGERQVSVRGLFGDEEGRVQIVHRSRQHPKDVGRLVELTKSDPARRRAPCIRHEARGGGCGGCALMELGEEAQREQKRAMLAALGLEVDVVHGGQALGYRWSSKRVAFARAGKIRIGSWARGSHDGAVMTGCLVEHPLISAAADEVENQARELGTSAFDEKTGQGDLRYVWLKTDGERVVVTLMGDSQSEGLARLAAHLSLPTTLWISQQTADGNAIRGEAPVCVHGEAELHVNIAGVRVALGPLGFLQPNPTAIADAYGALVEGLAGGVAWDLYAGIGSTTALLSGGFDEVVPCESYPESAEKLGVAPMRAADFLTERAAERPDAIVANPPRKGLGEAVCASLAQIGAPHLRVMSCGPEGLRRDLDRLVAAGYRLERLLAFDTLPQTPHVEVVARLSLV